MAELALGLTKTVVEGALSRIQWAIEEEGKLKEGVLQDLDSITGEFQMMQSFLKVANKERARKNEVVRAWVRQLRDLAFDVEDWVEFVVHIDKDKSLCSCWWRLVPWWAVPRRLAPPRHLDAAAAEMKLLKARVHDVSQRNTRYNLFNSDDDSSSGSVLVSKVAVTPPTTVAILSSRAFEVLRQVWRDETDRLRQVISLENLITSKQIGDDLEVIWMWRADGSDASSDHIHMAYQDSKICQSFDCRAWVKISRPFNLQVFLDTLVAQLLFDGSSHQKPNGLTNTELIQRVTKEKKYLVVLEDVSDLVEWNTIRMYLSDYNCKKGSRVVVSTQNLRHATLCTGVPFIVSELGWYPDGRPSICAFYRKKGVDDLMFEKVPTETMQVVEIETERLPRLMAGSEGPEASPLDPGEELLGSQEPLPTATTNPHTARHLGDPRPPATVLPATAPLKSQHHTVPPHATGTNDKLHAGSGHHVMPPDQVRALARSLQNQRSLPRSTPP